MLAEPKLLKLNFGIMCLHILLMSTFVALPVNWRKQASRRRALENLSGDDAAVFVSVVPFIIYAEVKRRMKRVFLACVLLILIAEIVLWSANVRFWGDCGRADILPRLQPDGSPPPLAYQ